MAGCCRGGLTARLSVVPWRVAGWGAQAAKTRARRARDSEDRLEDRTLCLLVRGEPAQEVLLGCKKRGFGRGKYVGLGGKVEPGETLEQAAVREMLEEAEVSVSERALEPAGRLVFAFPFKPEWDMAAWVFVARRWLGEPGETEEVQPRWFPVQGIPYAEMWDDARYWLPYVLAGARVEARFVYGADNATVAEATVLGS